VSRPCIALAAAFLVGGLAAESRAAEPGERIAVDVVEVTGNARTARATVLDLLPRPPPAVYSRAELGDLERRLDNLEIFDKVDVHVFPAERRVEVSLREKWTLIPSVELSTGRTLEDMRVLLGATEYNFGGGGDALSVSLTREQRGYGARVGFYEHTFRRRRWTFSGEAYGASARYRFDDGASWNAGRGGVSVGFTSPPVLSPYVNLRVGADYTYEATSERVLASVPARAHTGGTEIAITYDRYEFHDLVSSGLRAEARFNVGALAQATRGQPRHAANVSVIGALPLWSRAVLMTRTMLSLSTTGNANFSTLLGSIDGVRGIEDNLYRNWAQALGNVELRQTFVVIGRWALQGVAFGDAAAFDPLDADGRPGGVVGAVSVGGGVRIIPTWLASVVVRADAAYLATPTERGFFQLGLSQYF